MKKLLPLFLILLLAISVRVNADEIYSKEDIEKAQKEHLYEFEHEGKKYEAYVLKFDMNDPLLRVDVAMAGDKIGSVANLETLAKSNSQGEVLGAINAAFFNMREDTQSASTIILNGEVEHIANYGSVMGFNAKNKLILERPYIKIQGAIDGQWEAPYYWEAENINHLYAKPFDKIMLFNSYYTGKMPTDIHCVVVDRNNVVGIYDHLPELSKTQYAVCAYDKSLLKSFKLGRNVEYRSRYFVDDGNKSTDKILSFDEIKTALGVGPTLVKDGQYAIAKDLERHSLSSFSLRSMIGMTQDNHLVMAVTSKMSFDTLAHLALELGLKDAINLDGGGSSSMISNGIPIRSTNRKLSNAVVVKRVKEPLTRVKLNDQELFFDQEPLIYEGRTMLPMRKILEKLGCDVEYDHESRKIKVSRYEKSFEFQVGSNEVTSSGKTYKMDVPIIVRRDMSFISVRFLTEFLGGKVEWNNEEKLVLLELPTTQTYYEIALAFYNQKSYEFALNEFAKVLDMNPEHIGALRYSANINETIFKDTRSALSNYLKIYEILPDDVENIKKLIQIYTNLNLEPEMIKMFEALLEVEPGDYAHMALARLYKSRDRDKSNFHYRWIMEHSKMEMNVREAQLNLNKK